MSQTPETTSPSSNIEGIFDAALKSYKKKTKKDLKKHDLFKRLENCDFPAAILAVFQVDPFRIGGDDTSKKWFLPTVNVLYAFSTTLSEGVGLIFSLAKVVFAGFGILLLAAKDVAASQDTVADIFGRIESFFGRLEVYTQFPLTAAMTNKMVQITVEVLGILATATKEMKRGLAKKFVKRIAGKTDLEDGLKKLDTLTNEEVVMASAQLLKITHNIDNKVTGVGDGVRCVDEKVQVVNDNIKAVGEIVQTIANDGKEVKATATKVKSIVQQTADDVDDVKRNQLRETLRRWQSPPDPSTNHNIASDRQHEGTAEWFFKGDKFKEWKMTGSLLWIHGKPGSGKSVLCSAIIKDITTLCEAGSASMAYFYFDFRDIDKKARRNVLPSLLTQLSSRSNPFCDIFSRLYKAHDNGGRRPSDSALTKCLKEMLTLPYQRPVYLIMDALDECPDTSDFPSPREQVLDLVKDLVSLRLPNLHVCVTSRLEVDISDALEPLASHTVSLQEEYGQQKDISDYVRSVVHVGSGKFMKRWRQEDKEHVIKALSESADGMFRWVYCQLEVLKNCLPQNLQRVLSELPESLDETYERVLKGIGRANRQQAHRLLQCLTVATRPLRAEELAEILALDFGAAKDGIPALNRDWRWDNQQQCVLSTCSSLIVIVDGVDDDFSSCRVVQFAHFSVKEFLTSDRLAALNADTSDFYINLEPAHTTMAQACLGTLLQSDGGSVDDGEVKGSSLARYASQHWVVHAQFGKVSLRVEDGMRRLFDPAKPYFAAWLKLYDIDIAWMSFLWGRPYRFKPAALYSASSLHDDYASLCLYYASLCGFRDLTKHLIAKYPRHVNARVGHNKSPLVAALRNSHIQVAELLHQHGAVLQVTGYRGLTLLHAASMDGLVDIAQWLLKLGADANAQEDDHITPLHSAAAKGHLEVAWTLLRHGVDVNATTRDNRTPLHEASASGHVDIVRLLIQHGADANTHLQKLLHLASSSRSPGTVQLLIDLGADVNKQDDNYSTPLHLASSEGDAETVQLLIQHGADVNAWNGRHSTPLYLTLSRGDNRWSYQIAQLLIEHGADVNTQDGNHSTPLHLSSSQGISETVQLLIQHGADVNARDQGYSTPLHLASCQADARTVRLLVEHGADVHAQNRSHSTPLHLASSSGNTETLQLLIEHGADVHAENDSHSTPLHLASSSWNAKAVRVLIDHGADVNAKDGRHSTPLHLACNFEAAQLLIQHGADIHARDKSHRTPLHLASSKGNAKNVRLLIERGLDVNACDGSHSTPLHLAISRQEPAADVVGLLLEYGANVDVDDGKGQTPFQIASSRGHHTIAQLLSDHLSSVE